MDIPLITKDTFNMIIKQKSIDNESMESIIKRIETVHTMFHNELPTEEQLKLFAFALQEPCSIISTLIDRAFYVGFSKGYQKCVDEVLKEYGTEKEN